MAGGFLSYVLYLSGENSFSFQPEKEGSKILKDQKIFKEEIKNEEIQRCRRTGL